MPPPRKRRRAFIAPPSPDQQTQTTPQRPPDEADLPEPTLPYDLLPEIAVRSDVTTLVLCAASCKVLRREILRPAFIRRVCRGLAGCAAAVPPCALGFLHAYDKSRMDVDKYHDQPPPAPCFSVAHPASPGVASFFEEHLAPFVARTAGKSLLGDYEPLTSRQGLVVLRRRYLGGDRSSEACVYDPMSGDRTFLPVPPNIRVRDRKVSEYVYGVSYTYVLLTAVDGIGIGGDSFLVLAADFSGLRPTKITVQTVSSDNAGDGACAWGPITTVATHPRSHWSSDSSLQPQCSAVVLCGLIHWLMYEEEEQYGDFRQVHLQFHFHILTYNVRTATAGLIELPKGKGDVRVPKDSKTSNLHLASSPDGRLSLHVADKRKISVWLMGPAGGAAGDGTVGHGTP
jgi:hypothetical protein